jgi:hypothetical protein
MRDTVGVEDAFGTVLLVVVAVGGLVAIATFLTSGRLYDHIGRGGLSLRDGSDRPAAEPAAGSRASAAEREAEIRQLLAARNERRVRQGKEALDVDEELARLTAPAIDPALRAEIRQLVVARNERRARQGREPLDVEAEVERQVQDLGRL